MGSLSGDIRAKASPPLDRRVAELAQRQYGVVTLSQLCELGVGKNAVNYRARVGRLHRIHRGVYAVGHAVLGAEGRRLAAVLACGPGAALSHRSAAAHWGLLKATGARVDVTAPRSRHGAQGIQLHRPRCLDAADITDHRGIPITTVARTLLDVAATAPKHHVERALAQAERLRLYDHDALAHLLARANGHRGHKRLEQATADQPQLTRSALEARFLALVRRAGLPEPQANVVIDAPDHPALEVDFLWAKHHLIVETDGYETHGTRQAFERDRAKDAALTAAGYRVLRFTWRSESATIERRLRALPDGELSPQSDW